MEAILRKEIVVNKILCRMLGVFVFVVLMSLGAFVRIPLPFTPVPLTLQTFFVLLSAVFLGVNLGLTTQLSYILLGALGLPIFAGAGSGLFYLTGPTGGYLAGFVLASLFAASFIKYAKNNLLMVFGILIAADIILLACGVAWLKVLFAWPIDRLLAMGFIPFISGDFLKAGAAAFLYCKLNSRIKEIF